MPLSKLRATCPLPEGWSSPEVFEDAFVADGIELRRAGLSAAMPGSGTEVNGAAAAVDERPLERAYYELVERVVTLEATRAAAPTFDLWTSDRTLAGRVTATDVFPESDRPAAWRYARSNGVALRGDWASACMHAFWELGERDRLLRSWYGAIRPVRVELPAGFPFLGRTPSYAWRAYSFPAERGTAWSRGVEVVGIYGLPTEPRAPLVMGYGARPGIGAALETAAREVTQSFAFLWGEPIPDVAPAPSPGPMFHLERFLFPESHAALVAWLEGAHVAHGAAWRCPEGAEDAAVRFVDLTSVCEHTNAHEGDDGRASAPWSFRVAKALCPAAVPLTFGESPFGSHLPPELVAHPIA